MYKTLKIKPHLKVVLADKTGETADISNKRRRSMKIS